jgi:hypothetical protein
MGTFSTARATSLSRVEQDGTHIYTGTVDIQWSVFGNPHGGYLLAMILDAACQMQRQPPPPASSTGRKPISHPDPAHLVTQYITGAKAGSVEIHVKVSNLPSTSLLSGDRQS